MTRRVLLAVAVLAIAACGATQPSASPGDDCALTTEPAPADEFDRGGGDLIDGKDFGAGVWRLCLAVPVVASAENAAWCEWKPDRTAVIGFSGLSVTIGAMTYDSGLLIGTNEFFLSGYQQGPVPPSGDATEDGRSGHLAFDAVPRVDPEHGAEPGLALRVVGVMRWQCGDPPPRR